MGGHYLTAKSQPAIPTAEMWAVIRPYCGDVPGWVDELVARVEAERVVVGTRDVPIGHSFAGPTYGGDSSNKEVPVTAPATAEAQQWSGWGTALKPAHEPVVVARKPLVGTVAGNVLGWGVGGLNIDGCRVAAESEGLGRWPANVVHDGSPEVCDRFPNSTSGKGTITITKREGTWDRKDKGMFDAGRSSTFEQYGDSGSASRFFAGLGWGDVDVGSFLYCAKAGKRERNAGDTDNHHPTVKPIALMRWLVRLVTPPDGTVLDPFLGSGTTAVAATLEGVRWVGCEMTEDYWPIIEGRVLWAEGQRGLL